MHRFIGKAALVTGAAGGIGAAIVLRVSEGRGAVAETVSGCGLRPGGNHPVCSQTMQSLPL